LDKSTFVFFCKYQSKINLLIGELSCKLIQHSEPGASMSRELDRKLSSDSGGSSEVEGPGGVLMKLWLMILLDMNVKLPRLAQMLDEFTQTHASRIKQDYTIDEATKGQRVVKINTAKANLRRALMDSKAMTIRTFFIGLKMLGGCRVTISVKLDFPSGRRSSLVSTVVNLGKVAVEESDDG